MKKNGFTLAELLGVIVILAAIALVAFPPIINQLRKSRSELDSALNNIIQTATDLYLEERNLPKTGEYCINVNVLIKDGKLVSPVSDSHGNVVDNYTFYINYEKGEQELEADTDNLCTVKHLVPKKNNIMN